MIDLANKRIEIVEKFLMTDVINDNYISLRYKLPYAPEVDVGSLHLSYKQGFEVRILTGVLECVALKKLVVA